MTECILKIGGNRKSTTIARQINRIGSFQYIDGLTESILIKLVSQLIQRSDGAVKKIIKQPGSGFIFRRKRFDPVFVVTLTGQPVL